MNNARHMRLLVNRLSASSIWRCSIENSMLCLFLKGGSTMEILKNNLLAFHYVHPLSLNRLALLLKEDATLENLTYINHKKLANLLNINEKKCREILDEYLRVKNTDFVEYYAHQQIVPIAFFDAEYPLNLLDVYDPPTVLYCKGHLAILQKTKKLAIVGSRESTNYSQKCLDIILPELISHDIVIVSGLAKGTDQMAHSTAIRLQGSTIAVLGNGLNHTYPRVHDNLQLYMEQYQLVLSEYPPYMPPRKWQFPMRNRIISGMSDAVLVTEAAKKSGTMSTVDYGLNHGRNIFSIPGNIFSPLSEGPNRLIQLGATLIWNGNQIIEETQKFK